MAKPQMLFGYQPPAAMSMMGQGVAEGMAKVGEIYGKGLASMGENLAKGITTAASTYAQGQQINKSADALQKFANTLPSEEGSVGQALQSYMNDPAVSNYDKVNFGQSVVGDYFKNMMEMRRIQEMNKGRMDLQGMRGAQGGASQTQPVTFTEMSLHQ
jgi:hypothetical protein